MVTLELADWAVIIMHADYGHIHEKEISADMLKLDIEVTIPF